MPLFNGPLFGGPLFGEGTAARADTPPEPLMLDKLVATVAKHSLTQLPPSDLVVRIFAPPGFGKRLAEMIPDGMKVADPSVGVAKIRGVQIVESAWMQPDALPWGEFADGSIRPLFREGEEG